MKRNHTKSLVAAAVGTIMFAAGLASPGMAASKRATADHSNAQAKAVTEAIAFKIDRSMKSKLETMQWTMAASKIGRPILSGNQYRLMNAVSQSGVKREPRTVAANFGWLPPHSNDFNMRILRQGGDGQVRFGDVVALEMKSYGWLRYKKQSRGINLSDDDNKPHFIWVVTGGTKGTKLVSGMPFALRNTKANAEMVYCERTWGIDLGWHGKSECGGKLAKVTKVVVGRNGLLAGDGLTGKGAKIVKNYICETAVYAGTASATGLTAGLASDFISDATLEAIDKCKKL